MCRYLIVNTHSRARTGIFRHSFIQHGNIIINNTTNAHGRYIEVYYMIHNMILYYIYTTHTRNNNDNNSSLGRD